jgi:hypothetical protein
MPQAKLTVKELRAKLATVPDNWSVHAYEEQSMLYPTARTLIIFRSNNSDAELQIEVDPS